MDHDARRKRVLVAPLDWGLGHATRSIPIIRELQKRGCDVTIASSGDALALLKIEFPDLPFFELASYRVHYSRSIPFIANLFRQLPKFLWTIRKEHEQTERIIKTKKIDFVISDNRFGCWSRVVPTVFITHQPNAQLPPQLKWLQSLTNSMNRVHIKKFTTCWIPDFPLDRITGDLTAKTHGLDVRWIGMVSRFASSKIITPVKYNYALLISGPEPQRTILEELFRKNMHTLPGKKIMVKGQPHLGREIVQSGDVDEVGHLQSDELQAVIESSEIIISRSGYTTIMDLAALNKKAFFIPTPGQTEQECLAAELKKRGITFYQEQKDFDLPEALIEMKKYTGFSNFDMSSKLLNAALDDLMKHASLP
jgi:uncharacterized protein (TIGR00661 family)